MMNSLSTMAAIPENSLKINNRVYFLTFEKLCTANYLKLNTVSIWGFKVMSRQFQSFDSSSGVKGLPIISPKLLMIV